MERLAAIRATHQGARTFARRCAARHKTAWSHLGFKPGAVAGEERAARFAVWVCKRQLHLTVGASPKVLTVLAASVKAIWCDAPRSASSLILPTIYRQYLRRR